MQYLRPNPNGQTAIKCLKKAKDLVSSRFFPVPTEKNNPNRRFLL